MKKCILFIGFLFGILCLHMSVSVSVAGISESSNPEVIRKKVHIPRNVNQVPIIDAKAGAIKTQSDLTGIERTSAPDRTSLSNAMTENRDVPEYDPTDKIDPFVPLFRETSQKERKEIQYKFAKKGPLTELEKLDLSQIKLTGVILAKSGNRGLVREASGKGHIISEGTRLGRHGGTVVSIFLNGFVIEHKMVDERGKESIQRREYKIYK